MSGIFLITIYSELSINLCCLSFFYALELGMSAIEAMGFTPVLAGINMPLVMGAEAILVAEDNKASLKFAR